MSDRRPRLQEDRVAPMATAKHDMLDGPCACGAWHDYEPWLIDWFREQGMLEEE